jgi:hypothetical protein
MEGNFCRRLPVVDDEKLMGVVTQTDLSKALTSAMVDLVPKIDKDRTSEIDEHDFKSGKSYLMQEKKPEKSTRIFAELLNRGYKGICICRTNPKRIREQYDLGETPLIWATDIKTDEPNIGPNDLVSLSNIISEFADKTKKGVVFIEAFTYLLDRNDFTRVLHSLQHIRDVISESDSCLLVYLDTVVLSEKNLELLGQEIDEIKFRP